LRRLGAGEERTGQRKVTEWGTLLLLRTGRKIPGKVKTTSRPDAGGGTKHLTVGGGAGGIWTGVQRKVDPSPEPEPYCIGKGPSASSIGKEGRLHQELRVRIWWVTKKERKVMLPEARSSKRLEGGSNQDKMYRAVIHPHRETIRCGKDEEGRNSSYLASTNLSMCRYHSSAKKDKSLFRMEQFTKSRGAFGISSTKQTGGISTERGSKEKLLQLKFRRPEGGIGYVCQGRTRSGT